VEEVPLGTTRYCTVDGKPVLLANDGGDIFAMDGLCPHRLYPLEGAGLWQGIVDCPWHHFQYDVRTGENLYPANVYPRDSPELLEQVSPLKCYKVELREGEIWVDLD
jgi:3-phenylpropionate/trans-cinnamate dioxygenase ferredoxin component